MVVSGELFRHGRGGGGGGEETGHSALYSAPLSLLLWAAFDGGVVCVAIT